MLLFGKEIDLKELSGRFGDISRLCLIKSYEFNDGFSRGIRAIDMKSPAGLDFTILVDRCMDISYLAYKSIPISWRTFIPESHPSYFDSKWNEWLRNFSGGLFITGGFTKFGLPCIDEDKEYNLHGRASNLPGFNTSYDIFWEDGTYKLQFKGKTRQFKFYEENLEFRRKITTFIDKPKIVIEDNVKNYTGKKVPVMILYHVNIGYPVLDRHANLIESKAKVTAWDEYSEKKLKDFNKFGEPSLDSIDEAYYHDIEEDKEGFANVAIVNEAFDNNKGIGVWLRFKKDTLPCFTEWKYLNIDGDYVCGIEPGNHYVSSIKKAKDENTLKFLEPYEEKDYRIELSILPSNKEIEKFRSDYT
jgi:hypothetical protein